MSEFGFQVCAKIQVQSESCKASAEFTETPNITGLIPSNIYSSRRITRESDFRVFQRHKIVIQFTFCAPQKTKNMKFNVVMKVKSFG
jgi:hypothetical protein